MVYLAKFLLFVCLCGSFFQWSYASEEKLSGDMKIKNTVTDAQTHQLLKTKINELVKVSRYFLGNQGMASLDSLKIIVDSQTELPALHIKKSNIELNLPYTPTRNVLSTYNMYAITDAIIRVMSNTQKVTRPGELLVPDWILAALVHRMNSNISYNLLPFSFPLYPHCAIIFNENGLLPSPDSLAGNPVNPNDLIFYSVYAEMCDLSLRIHEQAGRKDWSPIFLKKIKTINIQERNTATLYVSWFGKEAYDSNSEIIRQSWFNDQAKKIVLNGTTYRAPELVLKDFQELANAVIYKIQQTSEGQIILVDSSCKLEELGTKYQEMANPTNVITQINSSMNEIYDYSPYFMRAGLGKIIHLIRNLKKENADQFSTHFKEAEQLILDGVQKQQALAHYLDKISDKQDIFRKKMILYYQLQREQQAQSHQFWPKLQDYLDQIEKKQRLRP